MRRWLRNAWDWCAEHDKELSTWLLIVSLFLAVWSVWKVNQAGAAIAHTDDLQTWTYRRDEAEECLEDWETYEGTSHIYTDLPTAVDLYIRGRGSGETPDSADLEFFREVLRELFRQYPQPDCDRDTATDRYVRAQDELSKLQEE